MLSRPSSVRLPTLFFESSPLSPLFVPTQATKLLARARLFEKGKKWRAP